MSNCVAFIINPVQGISIILEMAFNWIVICSRWLTCILILFSGYEGQNHSQPGSANGGDGTSSLDCLSLIVESISPGAAAVAGLLQGQGRPSARLQEASKREDIGEHVVHTAPIVRIIQQWQAAIIWTMFLIGYKQNMRCGIWGSHSGGYEEYYLLGCNAL
jgi:hypothetical protein